MATSNESTMKWKVDVSQLKSAMQDAKRSINQANAEFKSATAGMDKWTKSSEGLEAKLTQLNKVLPEQKKILQNLEDQYAIVAKEQGENSKAASDLKIQIENQKAAIGKTEASIKTYNDQLVEVKKQEAEADSAMGKLTKTIEEQESELKDLKDQYKNAVIQYGENSDEAKALADQIQDLSGELSDNKRKMSDAASAADSLDTSLEETGEEAEEQADGGFTVLKGALANLVTEGINLVIDGLKNLGETAVDAWKDLDSGMDTIIAKTGATGDAAKELNDVYKNLSKKVVGSYDEMGEAVGEVNTRFGLTGDDLEDLSEKFLKFSKLNGTNVSGSIDKVQSTMAAWGITTENTGAFLDLLNKAGQDTGISVDRLADSLKTNASSLMEMGLSATESASFLANLDKNGLDASSTMSGLKKALTNAAKEGKPMSVALSEMQDSILNAKDSTEAITAASELFGSKSGAAIATAVRTGKINFKDLGTSMTGFVGNLDETYDATLDVKDEIALMIQSTKTDMAEMVATFLEKYGPQIKTALGKIKDVIEKVFKVVGDVFGFTEKHWKTIVDIVKFVGIAVGVFKGFFLAVQVGTGIMAALNAVMAMNPMTLIVAAIAALVAAFVLLWQNCDEFREFWLNLWEDIKTGAIYAWENYLKPAFEAIGEFFSWLWEEVLSPTLDVLIEVFTEVFKGIQDLWENVLKPVFEKIAEIFTWLWENVLSPYLGLVKDYFTEVFKTIQNIWENILWPVFKKIAEIFTWLWENVLSPYLGLVKDYFTEVFEIIQTIWNDILWPVFKAIGDTFESLWTDHLEPTIKSVKEAFKTMAKVIGDIWKGLWDDTLKPVINGILGGIETLANGVVGGMNKVIDALNTLNFTIPDWVPELGGKSFGFDIGRLSTVSLPRLMEGGILKKGQVGLLEGAGAEAVVPLDRNKKWIAAVVHDMIKVMDVEGARAVVGGSAAGIALAGGYVGGRGVTQNITFNQTNNSPKALDRLTVYRDTNSLLFSAKVRLGDV